MNNALLVEAAKVVKAFGPVDTTGAGQDGAWVSLAQISAELRPRWYRPGRRP